jgi:hypothetical protein
VGEAKSRSRRRAEILADAPRCIYCASAADTVEHMPPIAMFKHRQRLSGMEFPCCEICNHSTRAADAAASFFARISPQDAPPQWEVDEAYKLVGTLAKVAPGSILEIFNPAKNRRVWSKGRDPFLTSKRELTLDGPITHALMTVFAAKLGMALYKEHVGSPLETHGSVFTQFYFNSGLDRQTAEATVGILPMGGQLSQGRLSSGRQFNYRYNCDNNSILFVFAAFHDNLFVRSVATAEPEKYRDIFAGEYNGSEVQIGQLKQLSASWVTI